MSVHRCARIGVLGLLIAPTSAPAGFSDATATSGLFSGQPSWGAQVVDMDADGDVDLYNAHHYYSGALFTNDGSGVFSVWGIPQLVTHVADRHGFLWVDLDGDELLEVICSHGGGGGCNCEDGGNELWRSTAPGVFEVVPGSGGMLEPIARGRNFSAADIDGDGDLDLFHGKAPLASSPNSLFRNDGSLAFVDVAPTWGLDENEGTNGALFADYDDDGDPDVLLGGEEFFRPTALWRNDGTTFTDVTAVAFGTLPIVAGADWGDFDNDGDLDLVTCEGAEGIWDAWNQDGSEYWFFANDRFGDDGVDAFSFETPGEEPAATFRLRGQFWPPQILLGPDAVEAPGATVTLTDAYVGAPTFAPGVDDALYCWRESPGGPWQIRVSAPPGSFGNYSGRIETAAGVTNPAASNLETASLASGLVRVWRNDGGVFGEITSTLGLGSSTNPRSVQWVDFDNDGDLDLHQTNKGTVAIGNEPDILWRHDAAGFVPLTGTGWVPGFSVGFTDGGAWADFDLDGDLDLFLQEGVGPLFFTIGMQALYYRNDGPAGNWLAVTLGSTSAGGTPVGTKVTAHAGTLRVHRRMSANSWRAFQGTLALHLGLGAAAAVDSLVVEWPDGVRQVLGSIPANQSVRVTPDTVTGAAATVDSRPQVGRVVPQPAYGEQRVRITLRDEARLRVTVHDVAGRRVRTLHDARVPRGDLVVSWDGRDTFGRRVPSGVYFVRGAGDVVFHRKAVRIR